MTLYDGNNNLLSDIDEQEFMDQWLLDGKDKPRIKTVGGKHIILNATEITQIESEWASNKALNDEENRTERIKTETQKRIINQLPEGELENFIIKELNLLMLNAKLDNIVIKGGTLTVEQQAQKTLFEELEIKITDIRNTSKTARINGDSHAKFKSDLDIKGYL